MPFSVSHSDKVSSVVDVFKGFASNNDYELTDHCGTDKRLKLRYDCIAKRPQTSFISKKSVKSMQLLLSQQLFK